MSLFLPYSDDTLIQVDNIHGHPFVSHLAGILMRTFSNHQPLPVSAHTMDQSPASLFESYSHDFQQLVNKLTFQLETESKGLTGEPLKALIRRSEAELEEGEEIISQMEVELPSIPQSIRSKYTLNFKSYKAQLEKLRKQFRDAKQAVLRSDLLGNTDASLRDDPYSDSPTDYSQRTRLLQGTERLADGSRRLEESHRLALETESVGADILRNLRGQREQIEHSRDVLASADTSIDRASGTLKKMIFRMYQQHFLTYGIIAILVFLIIIVVWGKLKG
ncbi:V-SNARE [Phaffia rhodozyma]|uniref:V-SNARE n=1 Tax=Phaffia rhodozyma TaxID=264483 RepID=A0A0F7SE50_PHARH|nr:V-SNARE [Phaffia rhodozyma]